jgi:SAM-dependent MidA family methyltransferase
MTKIPTPERPETVKNQPPNHLPAAAQRALAEAAREHGGTGINCSFTTQGAMLSRLGIAARSSRLAIKLSGEQLAAHLAATRRLTDDAEMGSLFKVLALYPNTSSPPPGAE